MSLNPQVRMLQIMQNLQPAMRKKSYEAFEAWQDKARTRLQALLGLPLEYAPANFRIEWTDDTCPDFSEIRFLFTSEPGTDVSCHLLLPKNAPEKLPRPQVHIFSKLYFARLRFAFSTLYRYSTKKYPAYHEPGDHQEY